jgi:DNA repair photolyase
MKDEGEAKLGRARPDRAAVPPALKGRGTAHRIGHRFESLERVAPIAAEGVTCVDDGDVVSGSPTTELRFEQAVRIIATNDSPDVPFEQSINPYRGCEHGCIYCFARPTHSYLGLSPGLDFERIIIAKRNAVERFEAQITRPGYRCQTITLGAATDPYQPVERRLKLTRGLVEVAARYRHPICIVTKSPLVERDIDLLAPMAADRLAAVMMTVTTVDPDLARILEPRAGAPWRRLQAIGRLSAAGIPVALSVGPVIPFINDGDIERIVEAAAAAGARSVHHTVIRLPWEVAPLFEQWLHDHYPERAARVMARIRELRGGRRNDPRFGTRMKGEGIYANLIRARVERAARRHRLDRATDLDTSRFVLSSRAGPPTRVSAPDDGGPQLSLI